MLWKGIEVLEIDPDRVGPIEDAMDRDIVVLDSETGLRAQDAPTLAPAPVRPFTWTALSRTEIAELLAFREARLGRLVPFWLPSWQSDLSLAANALAGDEVLSVSRVNYAELIYPISRARRHIAIYAAGHPDSYHEVMDVDDPGDGLTESLTITPPAPYALSALTTRISFLRLCRLEQDEIETRFLSLRAARSEIRVKEVPNEVPV